MYFVYFLRSESDPDKTYIGYTKCLLDRLAQHNEGTVRAHTRRYRPWRLEAFVLADTRAIALEVERYFKSPSGKEKFTRFQTANPEVENPIEAFFSSQEVGRRFGRSIFKVKKNKVVMMTTCD